VYWAAMSGIFAGTSSPHPRRCHLRSPATAHRQDDVTPGGSGARLWILKLVAYQLVDARSILGIMTTQIAIRLEDQELAALDAEVAEGRAANRSEAVRHGIARLQRDQRYRVEETELVELVRRGEAVYPDLDGILDLPHPPLD